MVILTVSLSALGKNYHVWNIVRQFSPFEVCGTISQSIARLSINCLESLTVISVIFVSNMETWSGCVEWYIESLACTIGDRWDTATYLMVKRSYREIRELKQFE